jgi:glucose/mannose-6-phosphate isomerase
MLDQVRSLGEQLRWARDLELPPLEQNSEVLIAGMGGSGIAGDFASALTYGSAGRVTVHKAYAPLPGWVGEAKPLLVAISYSGNTEETLSSAGEAEADLAVVTLTTGGELARLSSERGWPGIAVPSGVQPRAAVGYMLGAVVRVVAAVGLLPDQASPLGEAADLADRELAEGSESWDAASRVAEQLEGRIPIVYGGGPITGAVAQRWKTQINENAKTPSWHSVLPELDHNELVGWEAMPDVTRQHLGIVALTDASDHPRVRARLAHSRDLTQFAVPWVGEVASQGDSPLARLVSLIVMGDLVSYMMAGRAGVDPVPVQTIEKLKKLLAEE